MAQRAKARAPWLGRIRTSRPPHGAGAIPGRWGLCFRVEEAVRLDAHPQPAPERQHETLPHFERGGTREPRHEPEVRCDPGPRALLLAFLVALFMTLPGPAQALDAWDSMYATAQHMNELLNTTLLDEEHSPFTRLKEAQIREEMRDYDRSRS